MRGAPFKVIPGGIHARAAGWKRAEHPVQRPCYYVVTRAESAADALADWSFPVVSLIMVEGNGYVVVTSPIE